MAVAPLLGSSNAASICDQVAYLDEFAVKPAEVIGNDASDEVATGEVVRSGGEAVGCQTQSPPPYDKSPVLSVLFAMFLHGGWLHLLGNLLFLFVFGNNVEDRLGRVRYLVFYLACGYAATYGFALFFAGSTRRWSARRGDRRRAGRLPGAVPAGAGVVAADVPVLPAGPAARVAGARQLVRPAVPVHPGCRAHRGDRDGLPRARDRLRGRCCPGLAAARHRPPTACAGPALGPVRAAAALAPQVAGLLEQDHPGLEGGPAAR
jgi:hypothetical protein